MDQFVTNPEAALRKLMRRPKSGPLRFLMDDSNRMLTTQPEMNAAIRQHYSQVFQAPQGHALPGVPRTAEQLNEWLKDFNNTLRDSHPTLKRVFEQSKGNAAHYTTLLQNITEAELRGALEHSKQTSSPGDDGTNAWMWKQLLEQEAAQQHKPITFAMLALFNAILLEQATCLAQTSWSLW